MTPTFLFSVANAVTTGAWLLLALTLFTFPQLRRGLGFLVPIGLSGLYGISLTIGLTQAEGSFASLPAVRSLFANDWALLAGWVHYLAFDFFIGVTLTEWALSRRVSCWIILPLLPVTFMFGPVGYLGFRMLHLVRDRSGLARVTATRP